MSKKTIIIIIVIVVILFLIVLAFKHFIMEKILIWPVKGRITSRFGYRTHPVTGEKSSFHNGLDIAAPRGTEIKAPLSGKIASISTHAAGGNQIVMIHENNWRTGYAHLDSYGKFKVGDSVKQGDIIAYVGNTGQSTGPHLHFTLTNPKGEKVDPEKYLDKVLA